MTPYITSESTIRPKEIERGYSTVYQRRDIHRVTVEDEDGERTEMWRYEERKMTPAEYTEMQAESASAVASITFVTLAEGGQIDDVTAGEHVDLFSPWAAGVAYAVGNIRTHGDKLYRCLQAHTSQEDWTPDAAASLWALIADPAEEWPAWSQPVGAHDAYDIGDQVSHGGKHWVSDVGGNVWEPGVYGWREKI